MQFKLTAKLRILLFLLSFILTKIAFAFDIKKINNDYVDRFVFSISVSQNNTTCQKNNGSIFIQANNGVPPYSFTLNTSTRSTGIFLYLFAGTYNITVTDATGQIVTQSVVLTNMFGATSALITSQTSPTSCTTQDGNLTITGSGGTAPYMYSLDNINYQSSSLFPNLSAGAYLPIVKDLNGCISSLESFSKIHAIEVPCLLQSNGESFSYHCGPFESYFGVYISGGKPPYRYSLDGINYQTNFSFYPLSAGFYLIRIKDANGFIRLFSASVVDPCYYSFSINVSVQPAFCGSNGAINVTPTNGLAPYEYSLDGINFQSNNQFAGLVPGGYTVTVKDFYNLTNSKFVNVSNNCVNLATTPTSSTCNYNNGSIFAQGSNGSAPYSYSINGGVYLTNNNFINLAAGNYIIRVKDALGAIAESNTVITNISGPQLSISSIDFTGCIMNTGSVKGQVQGGTPPLSYSLNGIDFQTSNVFSGLAQGLYNLVVKDANGCLDSRPAIVGLKNDLIVNAIDTTKICEGKSEKIACQSNATNFSWSPSQGLSNTSILQPVANPMLTTKYVITGSYGACSKKDSVIVFVKPAPIPIAGQGNTICYGQNSSLSAAPGQFSYSWQPSTYLTNSNGPNTNVNKPAQSITYALKVIGYNGCESIKNDSVTIKVLPPPKIFIGNDTILSIGESLKLKATDVNVVGFNQYEWSPSFGLSNPNIPDPVINSISKNSTYAVIAKTSVGCEASDTINIKVFLKADIYVPNAFSPNGDGKNDVLKAIPVGIKIFKSFTVFDRFGQKVFWTSDANKGWDGKVNNSSSNTKSYVWIASGIDFKNNYIERKGSVLLIR